MVLITEVMIPWEKVVCCLENEQIGDVAGEFLTRKISSVLVVDSSNEKVKGIITKTDIINAFLSKISKETSVRNIMSNYVTVAHAKDGRDKVGQLMIDNQIHHVVILDQEEKPIGLVSSFDIVNHLVEESKLELGKLLMSMPRQTPIFK